MTAITNTDLETIKTRSWYVDHDESMGSIAVLVNGVSWERNALHWFTDKDELNKWASRYDSAI